MTLADLKPGEKAIIQSIEGGRHFRQRLFNMGIIPGEEVLCEKRGSFRPMVIQVNGTKLMLGFGMLSRISVRERE